MAKLGQAPEPDENPDWDEWLQIVEVIPGGIFDDDWAALPDEDKA